MKRQTISSLSQALGHFGDALFVAAPPASPPPPLLLPPNTAEGTVPSRLAYPRPLLLLPSPRPGCQLVLPTKSLSPTNSCPEECLTTIICIGRFFFLQVCLDFCQPSHPPIHPPSSNTPIDHWHLQSFLWDPRRGPRHSSPGHARTSCCPSPRVRRKMSYSWRAAESPGIALFFLDSRNHGDRFEQCNFGGPLFGSWRVQFLRR